MSQTFVRNEVFSLRRAGVAVDVSSMGRGDRESIPLEWSGPYHAMPEVSWSEALRDALWWARRPRAVLRLLAAIRLCTAAEPALLLRGVPTTARRLAGLDTRVVHTHFGWRAIVPALYVAALLGVPATITTHAADIFMPSRRLAQRLAGMARVVTVCRSNVPHLTALGVPDSKVSVIPCGVDTDVAVEPVADHRRVVSVGRLVEKKGFDVLLGAFSQVADRHDGAVLEIVGDGPEREALEAQTVRLGLGERVVFAGSLPNDEVLGRVVRAGGFVLACRRLPNGDSDAMPVSLREAMVRGRPVISTEVAGIPESVDEHVGWLVPSEDPDALASALHELLSDPAEAARRGLAGRDRVVRTASLETSAQAMLRVWDDLEAGR
nr:glycosyltransferase [Nocardioides flavescens]